MKERAEKLNMLLCANGFPTVAIHGEMKQEERSHNLGSQNTTSSSKRSLEF
jgi:superfamily II DNA/RNA helicase